MKMIERSSPGGTVIFCDEIRSEMYGTSNFIGVLPGFKLGIPKSEMPATFPRFAFCVKYFEPKDTFPSFDKVEICVPWKEKPFFVVDIDENVVKNSRNNASPELPMCGFTLNMNFDAFKVSDYGSLHVFVSNSNERLRLATLVIVPEEDEAPLDGE